MLNQIKTRYNIESDSDFARFLDITPQTLHNWKKRKTFDIQLVYTKCLNISAEWLITGEGEMLKNDSEINFSKNSDISYEVPTKYNEDYWRGRFDQLKEDYERLLNELNLNKSAAS